MTNEEGLDVMLAIIKDETGVTPEELRSKRREREILWARYMFCSLAEIYLGWVDRRIYSYVNYDRTTHIYARNKHREMLSMNDKDYSDLYKRVLNRVDVNIPKPQPLTQQQINGARIFNIRMLLGLEPVNNYSSI